MRNHMRYYIPNNVAVNSRKGQHVIPAKAGIQKVTVVNKYGFPLSRE